MVTREGVECIKALSEFKNWTGKGSPRLELTKKAAGFLGCITLLDGKKNERRLEIENTLELLKADELGLLDTVNLKRTYGDIEEAIKQNSYDH